LTRQEFATPLTKASSKGDRQTQPDPGGRLPPRQPGAPATQALLKW